MLVKLYITHIIGELVAHSSFLKPFTNKRSKPSILYVSQLLSNFLMWDYIYVIILKNTSYSTVFTCSQDTRQIHAYTLQTCLLRGLLTTMFSRVLLYAQICMYRFVSVRGKLLKTKGLKQVAHLGI